MISESEFYDLARAAGEKHTHAVAQTETCGNCGHAWHGDHECEAIVEDVDGDRPCFCEYATRSKA